MKPLVYSKKEAEYKGLGWHRSCSDIAYYPSRKKANVTNSMFTLSFSFNFSCTIFHLLIKIDDNDTMYFAHCYPYTYSDCATYLNKLSKN